MSEFKDLVDAIQGVSADPPVKLRQGVVQSVQTGSSTVTVTIGGSTTAVSGIPYLTSYNPTVSDTVWLATDGRDWMVIGKLGAYSGGGGSSVIISDTAPAGASAGTLWIRSTDMSAFVRYNDGNSTQWVEIKKADDQGLATRITAEETLSATTNKSGLVPVIPTSVAVGSGSGSVSSSGVVTFTGASTITLNGVFSATYTTYQIILNVTSASALAVDYFRYSSGGTATTGSLWYTAGGYWGASGAGTSTVGSAAADMAVNVSVNTGYADISSLAQITLTKNRVMSNYAGFPNGVGGSVAYGLWNSTAAIDGFRIAHGSGTFTGTVQIYGYRN